jgi:hypothetical protein
MSILQADLPIAVRDEAVSLPRQPAVHVKEFPVCLKMIRTQESMPNRLDFAVLAVGLTAIYFLMLHGFWAPASPLIDQNAYEMGGKQFARTFSTGVKPVNDFVYVSAMYVRAADGTYYPKYPLGMSILYACFLWIGKWAGVSHGGTEWAFLLAPLSAAASTLGLYLFLRRIASGFASILGALLLSFSPLALVLVNQHWSHHPAMAMAVWGMYFLLAWWQQNGWWRGLAAGFLLGFAVLVRYTEGLLLLPLLFVVLNKLPYRTRTDLPWASLIGWGIIGGVAIGLSFTLPANHHAYFWITGAFAAAIFGLTVVCFRRFGRSNLFIGWPLTAFAAALLVACGVAGSPALPIPHVSGMVVVVLIKVMLAASALLLFTVRWNAWQLLIQIAWPIAGWLIPVLYLVTFNKLKMGSWTGYDSTNESTGFTWKQLAENWEYIFKQLNGTATFFYLPLAVLGLGMVFRRSWRFGLLLTLWLVPNLIIYGCYYWGVNMPTVIAPILFYLRFFLTCFPPLAVCAALLLDDLLQHARQRSGTERSTPGHRAAWAAGISVVAGAATGAVIHFLAPDLRVEIVALSSVLVALVAAASFEIGRGVAGPIAAGIVVAFTTGMSLYDNRGALDRDFVINANLCDVGRMVVDRIPAADMKKMPLLFTEDLGPINHLQFAGNFECYTKNVFTTLAARMVDQPDPNSPNPIQNARSEYTASVYKNKTDADLMKMQNDIMAKALRDGRRVFVVLPPDSLTAFLHCFVTPKLFKVKATWKWREPAEMSDEGHKAMLNFGLVGSIMLGHGTPQDWAMAEVALK